MQHAFLLRTTRAKNRANWCAPFMWCIIFPKIDFEIRFCLMENDARSLQGQISIYVVQEHLRLNIYIYIYIYIGRIQIQHFAIYPNVSQTYRL